MSFSVAKLYIKLDIAVFGVWTGSTITGGSYMDRFSLLFLKGLVMLRLWFVAIGTLLLFEVLVVLFVPVALLKLNTLKTLLPVPPKRLTGMVVLFVPGGTGSQ